MTPGPSSPTGLILVNEPYYNEAGFDSDRGLQEGYENSRCYNEMSLIRMVQSMTQLLKHPVEVFSQEIQEHFASNGWRLVHRLEAWLELHDGVERGPPSRASVRAAAHSRDGPAVVTAEPLNEQLALGAGGPVAVAHSSPGQRVVEEVEEEEEGCCIVEEELEDSGLSPSTTAASQQGLSLNSDCKGSLSANPPPAAAPQTSTGPPVTTTMATTTAPPAVSEAAELGSAAVAAAAVGSSGPGSQPAVRPKKRRKSYRSFLPERSGYPDIGFPLFPLSKGFVKSVGVVLQQYQVALAAAGIAQHSEDK